MELKLLSIDLIKTVNPGEYGFVVNKIHDCMNFYNTNHGFNYVVGGINSINVQFIDGNRQMSIHFSTTCGVVFSLSYNPINRTSVLGRLIGSSINHHDACYFDCSYQTSLRFNKILTDFRFPGN